MFLGEEETTSKSSKVNGWDLGGSCALYSWWHLQVNKKELLILALKTIVVCKKVQYYSSHCYHQAALCQKRASRATQAKARFPLTYFATKKFNSLFFPPISYKSWTFLTTREAEHISSVANECKNVISFSIFSPGGGEILEWRKGLKQQWRIRPVVVSKAELNCLKTFKFASTST